MNGIEEQMTKGDEKLPAVEGVSHRETHEQKIGEKIDEMASVLTFALTLQGMNYWFHDGPNHGTNKQ